jgi:hypothetical protein
MTNEDIGTHLHYDEEVATETYVLRNYAHLLTDEERAILDGDWPLVGAEPRTHARVGRPRPQAPAADSALGARAVRRGPRGPGEGDRSACRRRMGTRFGSPAAPTAARSDADRRIPSAPGAAPSFVNLISRNSF